jgi:RNA polymerase sigma factor (TIGR02999 family)
MGPRWATRASGLVYNVGSKATESSHLSKTGSPQDATAGPDDGQPNGGYLPGSPRAGHDDTTALLRQWAKGCERSGERALSRLYPDLARLASSRAAGWSLAISSSDLLQEVAVRLARQERTEWRDRCHFFAVAARLAHRVLVDEARRQRCRKRGNGERSLGLDDVPGASCEPLLDLEWALDRLRRIDATAFRLVELRYFAGLSMSETAEALGVSISTAVRRWRFARSWLSTQLTGAADGR